MKTSELRSMSVEDLRAELQEQERAYFNLRFRKAAGEDIGSAEAKRVALLGSFAKKSGEPAAVFWAHVILPAAVLDLTDAGVLAALGTTDAEIHDPDWRSQPAASPSEVLGAAAFRDGRFAAIKYWSVRARAAGRSGFCLCIFKTRVQAPCRVEFVSAELGLNEIWT